MVSFTSICLCALIAVCFWTGIGFPIARKVLPPSLAWSFAPAIGWAVYSTATFTVLSLTGMSAAKVYAISAVFVAAALGARH